MPEVSLIWLNEPSLEDLDPAQVARAAGVELYQDGPLEAAVAAGPPSLLDQEMRSQVAGKPLVWLDLAAQVGGGAREHRFQRAVAAVAQAAGQAAASTEAQERPEALSTVLVAGQGLSALVAAAQATALGHQVLLASPAQELQTPGPDEEPQMVARSAADLPQGVQVALQTRLTGLSGAAGDFSAQLSGPQGEYQQRFGGVMLAPPAISQPDQLGIDSGLLTPLEQLEVQQVSGPAEGWLQAAVLALAPGPGSAMSFMRAAGTALALQQRPRVQATLLFREAEVATEGGERLYRAARQAGVLAGRVGPQEPRVLQEGRLLAWHDPVLDQELQLAPDLVVLAQGHQGQAPSFFDELVQWPDWQRLAPENPRLGSGRTARSGLYLLGALKGTAPGEARRAEAVAAAGHLHGMLDGSAPPAPQVIRRLCALCLTCLRACPHGAVSRQGHRITRLPAACQACGLCASLCPQGAIVPAGADQQALLAGLKRGLGLAPQPRLVLFACRHSALQAMAELSRQGHQWPAGLLVCPLNCSGSVSERLIMQALAQGADGVLVAGCHQGNCRSLTGNAQSRLGADWARRLVAELGLPQHKVRFINLASNQPAALSQAVAAMAEELA